MKKTILFLCDIHGTLIGNIDNTEEDYIKFNSLLNNLSLNNNIIFSIVSTENQETINYYQQLLKKYLNNNVILGRQFYEDGYIYNDEAFNYSIGKCVQVLGYIEELLEKYDISKIYFADDNDFNQEMIKEIINLKYPNIIFETIIPKSLNGLSELNKLVEDIKYNLKK